MKQQQFESVISGIQELIIQQKVNGIKNTPSNSQEFLNQIPSNLRENSLSYSETISRTLSSFYQKLSIKPPELRKMLSNSIKISFKLVSTEKKKLLATEVWQLLWVPIFSDKNIFDIQKTVKEIQSLLRGIITLSSFLPNWKMFIENKNQNVSNCYISYQITFGNLTKIKQAGINRGEFEFQSSLEEKKFFCRVHYNLIANLSKVLSPIQNQAQTQSQKQKQEHQIGKKSSVTTLVTCYSEGLPCLAGLSRKISIYSYYDPENDITFLSNDEFSFQNNTSQQDPNTPLLKCLKPFVQQTPSLQPFQSLPIQQQYEMILVQQDEKLFKFKQSLKQLLSITSFISM